jgi:hypothetical protein
VRFRADGAQQPLVARERCLQTGHWAHKDGRLRGNALRHQAGELGLLVRLAADG